MRSVRLVGWYLLVLTSASPALFAGLVPLFGLLVNLFSIPWQSNGAPLPPGPGWQLIGWGLGAAFFGMAAWPFVLMASLLAGGWRWPGTRWCLGVFAAGLALLVLQSYLDWYGAESYWLFG